VQVGTSRPGNKASDVISRRYRDYSNKLRLALWLSSLLPTTSANFNAFGLGTSEIFYGARRVKAESLPLVAGLRILEVLVLFNARPGRS
jgi:hypothetical protein